VTSPIRELPGERDFGLAFDYSVWTANSVVSLHNVPWNNDYRDVVLFDSNAALDDYLENQPTPKITVNNVTYLRVGVPIRLQIPFNSAYKFNYLRAFNPAQPTGMGDTARAFYYFITDVQFVNPSVTQFTLQLDIFQTFIHEVAFGNCYIERGHIGIANENNFNDYGREFLAIPEGLDVGGEYTIEKSWRREIASARDVFVDGEVINVTPDILVISNADLEADPGTVDKPKLNTATGSQMNNLPNGANIYIFNDVQWANFLTEFSSLTHITQGIMSVTAIPSSNPFDYPTETVFIGETATAQKVLAGSPRRDLTALTPTINWRDSIDLGRYANLKKFLTYPYCVVELTSYTGTPLVLKPECWNDADASVVTLPYFAPPNPRIMFYPYRYNAGGVAPQTDANGPIHDGGEFLDMATGIFNFPTFSVLNNGYMAFLASNSNSIPYQYQSAEWSQQKALNGAMNAYKQSTNSIDTSRDVNKLENAAARSMTNLQNQTAGYNAIVGGANGIVNGITSRNPVGAITSVANNAASWAIQTNQNTQSMGISTNLSSAVNQAQNANSGFMRDTNRDFAEFAAKGDYENQIAGIQARVQDAKLIQPTTSGQMGGDAFLLANFQWGYDIKVKMINGAAMASVGEYWLRYGYAVNRFARMPESFHCMTKFTYWKLRETYITSSTCPESFKQALRGIFEKGVTVWQNANDIGNIDIADNNALEGIVL